MSKTNLFPSVDANIHPSPSSTRQRPYSLFTKQSTFSFCPPTTPTPTPSLYTKNRSASVSKMIQSSTTENQLMKWIPLIRMVQRVQGKVKKEGFFFWCRLEAIAKERQLQVKLGQQSQYIKSGKVEETLTRALGKQQNQQQLLPPNPISHQVTATSLTLPTPQPIRQDVPASILSDPIVKQQQQKDNLVLESILVERQQQVLVEAGITLNHQLQQQQPLLEQLPSQLSTPLSPPPPSIPLQQPPKQPHPKSLSPSPTQTLLTTTTTILHTHLTQQTRSCFLEILHHSNKSLSLNKMSLISFKNCQRNVLFSAIRNIKRHSHQIMKADIVGNVLRAILRRVEGEVWRGVVGWGKEREQEKEIEREREKEREEKIGQKKEEEVRRLVEVDQGKLEQLDEQGKYECNQTNDNPIELLNSKQPQSLSLTQGPVQLQVSDKLSSIMPISEPIPPKAIIEPKKQSPSSSALINLNPSKPLKLNPSRSLNLKPTPSHLRITFKPDPPLPSLLLTLPSPHHNQQRVKKLPRLHPEQALFQLPDISQITLFDSEVSSRNWVVVKKITEKKKGGRRAKGEKTTEGESTKRTERSEFNERSQFNDEEQEEEEGRSAKTYEEETMLYVQAQTSPRFREQPSSQKQPSLQLQKHSSYSSSSSYSCFSSTPTIIPKSHSLANITLLSHHPSSTFSSQSPSMTNTNPTPVSTKKLVGLFSKKKSVELLSTGMGKEALMVKGYETKGGSGGSKMGMGKSSGNENRDGSNGYSSSNGNIGKKKDNNSSLKESKDNNKNINKTPSSSSIYITTNTNTNNPNPNNKYPSQPQPHTTTKPSSRHIPTQQPSTKTLHIRDKSAASSTKLVEKYVNLSAKRVNTEKKEPKTCKRESQVGGEGNNKSDYGIWCNSEKRRHLVTGSNSNTNSNGNYSNSKHQYHHQNHNQKQNQLSEFNTVTTHTTHTAHTNNKSKVIPYQQFIKKLSVNNNSHINTTSTSNIKSPSQSNIHRTPLKQLHQQNHLQQHPCPTTFHTIHMTQNQTNNNITTTLSPKHLTTQQLYSSCSAQLPRNNYYNGQPEKENDKEKEKGKKLRSKIDKIESNTARKMKLEIQSMINQRKKSSIGLLKF